jgi:hypothetical protein
MLRSQASFAIKLYSISFRPQNLPIHRMLGKVSFTADRSIAIAPFHAAVASNSRHVCISLVEKDWTSSLSPQTWMEIDINPKFLALSPFHRAPILTGGVQAYSSPQAFGTTSRPNTQPPITARTTPSHRQDKVCNYGNRERVDPCRLAARSTGNRILNSRNMRLADRA